MAGASVKNVGLPVLGLHHSAYRCRDSEETRAFWEDKVGFPLVMALELDQQKTTGSDVRYMHTFFDIGGPDPEAPDYLAFFEVPDRAEDDPDELYKRRWGMDLHFAMRVASHQRLREIYDRLLANGVEVEDPVAHGICTSIYFHCPSGYRWEFTAEDEDESAEMARHREDAHENLRNWNRWKAARREKAPV